MRPWFLSHFDKRSVEVQFCPTKPIKNQCKHLKNGGLKFKEASSWDCKQGKCYLLIRYVCGLQKVSAFCDQWWHIQRQTLASSPPFESPNTAASTELPVIIFTVSSAVFHLRFMQIIWISSANHQNIIWKSCVNCELLFDGFFSQTYFTRNMRQGTYTATSHQGGAEVASSNHNLWTWRVGGRVQLATRGIGWVHHCCCCCWLLLLIVTIYVCTYDSLLDVCSVNFCCIQNACIYNRRKFK